MTQEIIVGFDCCKDYDNPTRTPRIYPRRITMSAGQVINLYLRVVHPECYESCFTWKILRGGGFLDPEVGIQTYYNAPTENEDCAANPLIEVRCPRERLDKIQIAVNDLKTMTALQPAYLKLREWKKLDFYADPPKLPINRNPYFEPGILALYYSMNIDLYRCDGTRSVRHTVALVQRVRYVWGRAVLEPEMWVKIEAPMYLYDIYVAGTAEAAQQKALRLIIPNFLFGKRGTIPPQYRDLRPITLTPLPTRYVPPQTVDLRLNWVAKEGCCMYDVIEEE